MTPALSRGIRRRQQKDFEAQLKSMGCDPTEILVMIAMNRVPCVCVVKGIPGKERVPIAEGAASKCECRGMDGDCWRCGGTGAARVYERTCESCWGTLLEAVSPKVRADVAGKMLDKLVPDLRSIDHTSSDGSQQKRIEVVVLSRGPDGKVKLPEIMEAPATRSLN